MKQLHLFNKQYPRKSYKEKNKPVPVFVGGSGWLVRAPNGLTREELEHELKVIRVAREIHSGRLMELIK